MHAHVYVKCYLFFRQVQNGEMDVFHLKIYYVTSEVPKRDCTLEEKLYSNGCTNTKMTFV